MEKPYSISTRLRHGWNAFRNKDPASDSIIPPFGGVLMPGTSFRPDRKRPIYTVDPTMINSIFTRMAMDAASSTFEHIRTTSDGGYLEKIPSSLNRVFNVEANLDQSGQEFKFDMLMSMLDEGCIAAVPIETSTDPIFGVTADTIETMRTGKIVNWYPDRIAVEVYNEETGMRQTIIVPKRNAAILTNPFYSIMNEPNSTLKRLNRRLALLDIADEKIGSSKLDMIIQFPYQVKSGVQIDQAEKRRDRLLSQLQESEYGVAYADGTEKIIQLNRPVDNNLISNIEYLTNLLFSQLGLSPSIFDMSADEATMTNYYKRQIDPINDVIVNEFRRKYLPKTGGFENQTIWYYSEPFKFTPASSLAEIADKMIRNKVLTSNEMRGVIGYKPIDDPDADKLSNPNVPSIEPPIEEGIDEEVESLPMIMPSTE